MKIIINRRSKLHKFYTLLNDTFKFKNDDYPNSLCSYFWNYVAVVSKSFLATVLLVEVLIMFLSPLSLLIGFNPLGVIVLAGYVIVGLVFLIFYVAHKLSHSESPSINLVKEYLKAKKDKVCPLIVYRG